MKRHNQQGEGRFPPKEPFACSHCKAGNCNKCIDVMRVIYSQELICKCDRPGHSGEPTENQILDPETGAVHGPNVVVSADGQVSFPKSITCPSCGMTSHNPNDIEQKYCGNCHKFHDQMEL